ncbi:MAG: hypothetical protein MMC33_010119 [Icmadophila ericetorum]|nr:hypothetical protein [Icmadophila ericetorum]
MLLDSPSIRCYHSLKCKLLLLPLVPYASLLPSHHSQLHPITWCRQLSKLNSSLQFHENVPIDDHVGVGFFRLREVVPKRKSREQAYTVHEEPRTPSDLLTAALRRSNNPSAVPLAIARRRQWKYGKRCRQRYPGRRFYRTLHNILAQYISFIEPKLRLLQTEVQDLTVEEALDQDVQHIFDGHTITFLQSKGYDVADVVTWAWILASHSSERAALRLLVAAESGSTKNGGGREPIPTFLFLYFLRRSNFTAQACKYLVAYSVSRVFLRKDSAIATMLPQSLIQSPVWQVGSGDLSRQALYRVPPPNENKMTNSIAVMILARLLRHCRKVWPAAMVSIATMFSTYAHRRYTKNADGEISRETASRLSFLYNRILSLLSLPSAQHPMRALPYNQRAQFVIISGMTKFSPALVINREGYRAVTSVQLAHRKTNQEQEWARLKAKSWPPWKEDKLGLDADKGKELGITRAMESIARLNEAGYTHQTRERAATVYAGWDTDASPTIQTRVFFRPLFIQDINNKARSAPSWSKNPDEQLWSARISATRTLDEAWSCFLGYKAEQLPQYPAVYHAMMQRLILNDRRVRLEKSNKSDTNEQGFLLQEKSILPGDGKEVSAPPLNPQESVYLPELPPRPAEFFETMIKKKITLSARMLAFLLTHSDRFRTGMKYIESSDLPPATIRMLVDGDYSDELAVRRTLQPVKDHLFAAYVDFLVRVGWRNLAADFPSHAPPTFEPSLRMKPILQIERNSLLSGAVHSVLILKPRYRPAWYPLLKAFRTQSKAYLKICQHELDGAKWDRHLHCLRLWTDVSQILHQMEAIDLPLDFDGFQTICFGLEYLIRVGELITIEDDGEGKEKKNKPPLSKSIPHPKIQAEDILSAAILRVKTLFASLVRTKYSSTTLLHDSTPDILSLMPTTLESSDPIKLLPDFLETPAPSHLHLYIRILGLRRDYAAIQDLVLWMAHYATELKDVYQELNNGEAMMRKTLIAARVFLERRWAGNFKDKSPGEVGAPEEVLQIVYTTIEGVEDWDGWPWDEEVEAYCHNHGHGFV